MSILKVSPNKVKSFGVTIAKDGVLRSSIEILTQKNVNMNKIREIWPEIPYFDITNLPPLICETNILRQDQEWNFLKNYQMDESETATF